MKLFTFENEIKITTNIKLKYITTKQLIEEDFRLIYEFNKNLICDFYGILYDKRE